MERLYHGLSAWLCLLVGLSHFYIPEASVWEVLRAEIAISPPASLLILRVLPFKQEFKKKKSCGDDVCTQGYR